MTPRKTPATKTTLGCAALCAWLACATWAAADWPGRKTDFHGFAQYDFPVEDFAGRVVVPDKSAPGNPWIWRARFWGHQPAVDLALLERGFHVAYADVSNLFGSPRAVARWNVFYDFLVGRRGLARKPALEGMSRGGLIVYNWAAENPGKVACIYADAPVCDIKSWPGGKGKARPGPWELCKKAYGFTEQEAMDFRGNPIDNLGPLAAAKIPLLHVVGEADDVVPVEENTAILERRYRALGGEIEVIRKPGIKHVHGLDDPQPVVEFVLKHAAEAP
jgi:pimeloyl-ACP methyl ester carboxylesterase